MATVPSTGPDTPPSDGSAPLTSSRSSFSSEEEEAEHLVALLQTGTREEKIRARERLARLFEQRDMLDEAAELYERNIRIGVRDPNLYVRLAAVYRRQGKPELADEVLAEAARLPQPVSLGGEGASNAAATWTAEEPTYTPLKPPRPPIRVSQLLATAGRAVALAGAIALALGIGVFAFQALAPTLTSPSVALAPVPTATAVPIRCTFPSALALARDQLGPAVVGECVQSLTEADAPELRYQTTRGELTVRAADGRAIFSDGRQTWLRNPSGAVQNRLNADRFSWERTEDETTYAFSGVRPDGTPSRVRDDAVLPHKRIVAYYGNPLGGQVMGVLGDADTAGMLQRLRQVAQSYTALDPTRPAVPALELITPVAQHQAGADGLYRQRMPEELIERVARWAEENGWLLILDVQTGRSTVQAEVTPLLKYLRRPYVHLALDPEFAMPSDQVPGEEIGTMDARDVNWTIDTLNDLVVAERIPPKVLIVHRFLEGMLTNYRDIQPNPRVQVVIDMDGFGSPATKISKYDYHVGVQHVDYAGIKLFYQHDKPLMGPREILALDPVPDVVIYQ